MRELNFEPELCKVCKEHMVCDAQSEEVIEELVEILDNNFSPSFDFCPCCGCEVSDDTRDDRGYNLRVIKYLREEE